MYHHALLFGGVHNAVVRIVQRHIAADDTVAIEIVTGLHAQAAPRAQVTPTEVGRTNENLFGLLHDGIVNTDALALREPLVDSFLLLWCAIYSIEVLEDFAHARLVDAEGIDNGADIPDEDAGIPEVVFLLQVFQCYGQVGFLAE